MKKNNKRVRQFILQKMVDHWMEDNPGLREDIEKLSSEIVMFNIKWGTRLAVDDLTPTKN